MQLRKWMPIFTVVLLIVFCFCFFWPVVCTKPSDPFVLFFNLRCHIQDCPYLQYHGSRLQSLQWEAGGHDILLNHFNCGGPETIH